MLSNRPESKLKWTRKSITRNLQTYRNEPIQPYILREFTNAFNAEYFMDIGANIGYYSLLIAAEDLVSNVFAYEPIPATYKELLENVRSNALENKIICHPLAVSNTCGSYSMGVVSEISGRNAFTSTAAHNTRITTSQLVSTTMLDEMHDFSNKRIALKIDVEGHERHVLLGATALLQHNSAIIQIEILNRSIEDNDVVPLLEEFGYKKIFSAGPDKYFTNDAGLMECAGEVVEKALACFIRDFQRPLYIKSRFLLGLGIEISPRWMKLMPPIFRRMISRKRNH